MAKDRVTRKQLLNEPDEFITTANRLIGWAKENTRMLCVVGCAILVGAALFSVFSYYRQVRADAAETRLGAALAKYQTAMEGKDAAAAIDAVREDFEAILASYGGTPAGRLGGVIYGNICVAAKSYDDAIVQYKKALAHFGKESSLGDVILNGLAAAYQQKGDYNQAISYYKQMAEGTGTVLKDAALFNLGRLYGQLGQSEESRKIYARLGTEFPESMYAKLVK
jgi:tetratricopeptide (TPR) repeat protein